MIKSVGKPLILSLLVALPCAANPPAATCVTCHTDEAVKLGASIHASLGCQECHGGPRQYELSDEELARYSAGTTGQTFDHGDSFLGRPTRLEIPGRCGDCHADVERMNPYGLRADQLARYKTSGHGKALYAKQDDKVAVCTDCHGSPHEVLHADDPSSLTHPRNVPDMCGACHADQALMAPYDLPTEVVDEYRRSVHGVLLLEQGDTGAPNCASCHGNHSAMPPGFASVGAVCAQCHEHDAKYFATSIHAALPEHKGCVQCHGGGAGRHDHLIERISQPAGIMIERYAHLLTTEREPTVAQVSEAIHADPRQIIERALPTCTECHEELEDDESLPKLFSLLDQIAGAEQQFVYTANRLNEMSRGVLLVENQSFKFQDAKTHLIALSPLQHTLDNELVAEKVAELKAVCDEVNAELDELQTGLVWRKRLLLPIWAFALVFAAVLFVKFKRLKHAQVQPAGAAAAPAIESASRRGFLEVLVGIGSAVVGAALAIPALAYLWPAAKGGAATSVEVAGAASLVPGQSTMVQIGGKAVIVVRGREGYRAFSAVCTHLGCLVRWDQPANAFKCPCHAATFDANGGVVSGPPPAPLPEFDVKEVEDKVYVSL